MLSLARRSAIGGVATLWLLDARCQMILAVMRFSKGYGIR